MALDDKAVEVWQAIPTGGSRCAEHRLLIYRKRSFLGRDHHVSKMGFMRHGQAPRCDRGALLALKGVRGAMEQ